MRIQLLAAILISVGLLAACGGGSTSTSTSIPVQPIAQPIAQMIAITISPGNTTMAVSGSRQFTATVSGTNNTAVAWSVQEPSGGSITEGGLYIAPPNVGIFHVIATSKADPTKSAAASVTTAPFKLEVLPESVTLVPGGKYRFSVLTNVVSQPVTWSVVEADAGTITPDDSYGLYTAPNRLGTFHITAINPQYPQVQASALVSVVSRGFIAIPGNFDKNDMLEDVTTTLLADGRALIAGGLIDCASDLWTADCTAPFTVLRSAQIYDSSTRTFSFTGNLITGRYGHTATLLSNGRVLVVGGFESYCVCSTPVGTAEIFDPRDGTFSPTGNPQVSRAYHTATRLADGKVLIVGGVRGVPDLIANGAVPALASAEIYDPATESFSAVADMSKPRMSHTTTLLPNGMALVVGGAAVSIGAPGTHGDDTAELYDPAAHAFRPAGNMAAARFGHTATLLPTGKVLVAGGGVSGPTAPVFGVAGTNSVEIFDPQTNTWSGAPAMNAARGAHTATLLPAGQVLFAGGRVDDFEPVADLYSPATGASELVGPLVRSRFHHTATLMPDESVLVVGGDTGIIEIYLGQVPFTQ